MHPKLQTCSLSSFQKPRSPGDRLMLQKIICIQIRLRDEMRFGRELLCWEILDDTPWFCDFYKAHERRVFLGIPTSRCFSAAEADWVLLSAPVVWLLICLCPPSRMCTTPAPSSSTWECWVRRSTTTTTSVWWTWTADPGCWSAATPPPNTWSSPGRSLR